MNFLKIHFELLKRRNNELINFNKDYRDIFNIGELDDDPFIDDKPPEKQTQDKINIDYKLDNGLIIDDVLIQMRLCDNKVVKEPTNKQKQT